MKPQRTHDEDIALQMFIDVNSQVFGTLLENKNSKVDKFVAEELSKHVAYIFEYGVPL